MEPKSLLAGLSLGIILLVAVIAVGNVALSNVRKQLAACSAEKAELQKRLENMTRLLHALNQSLAEKEAELNKLSAELRGCRERSSRLEASLQAYRGEAERLREELGRLQQLYRAAASNATSCRQRLEAVMAELEAARKKIMEMNLSLARLQSAAAECSVLRANYTRLQEEYAALREEYNRLVTRARSLEEEVAELKQALASKQEECSKLRESLANATMELDAARRELERLRGAILRDAAWYDAVNQTLEARFYDNVLRVAADQCFREASRLGILGYSLAYRAERVFTYIETGYTIQLPQATRYIDPYTYTVRVAYGGLQLPNETMMLRAGDSWSLALLAYGLLQASVTGTNQRYYLIRLYTTKGVFSAALAVEDTPSGKLYYLVDPGDDYYNDAAIVLEAYIGPVPGGELTTLWPWQLSGHLKSTLLGKFQANMTYIDTMTWSIGAKPRVIDNPDTLLSHWYLWLRSLYGDMSLIKIDIHGIGVHAMLYSLAQAAQWLRLKG